MDDLFEETVTEKISYIRARDPSIQSLNCPKFDPTNLIPYFNEESKINVENSEKLQVYLRFKVPADDLHQVYEIEDDETLLFKITKNETTCDGNFRQQKVFRKYSFSKIFRPECSQAEVFNSVVKSKILHFINGQNCSLFTYGASGAGKTFTIMGTDKEPGIIPRALEYLFRTIPAIQEEALVKPIHPGVVIKLNTSTFKNERKASTQIIESVSDRKIHFETYSSMQKRLSNESCAVIDEGADVNVGVWVTFAEIYNEQIYDLLVPQPPRGKIRQKLQLGTIKGNTYIKNLKAVNVSSGLEAYLILHYGQQNLQYAETQLNSHSSRSHCVFTINLVQNSERENGSTVSQFHFCDLAGSERVKKTLNVGDRLKESNNINSSLSVLGRCINNVRLNQKNNNENVKVVPYRESKLTQLFQRALSGLEPIAMIVNINPSKLMVDESLHVLNFSAIAKEIVVNSQDIKKEDIKNYECSNCSEYKELLNQLQEELETIYEEHRRDRERITTGYQEILENERVQHKENVDFLNRVQEDRRNLLKRELEKVKYELQEYEEKNEILTDENERLKFELSKYRAASEVIDLSSDCYE